MSIDEIRNKINEFEGSQWWVEACRTLLHSLDMAQNVNVSRRENLNGNQSLIDELEAENAKLKSWNTQAKEQLEFIHKTCAGLVPDNFVDSHGLWASTLKVKYLADDYRRLLDKKRDELFHIL